MYDMTPLYTLFSLQISPVISQYLLVINKSNYEVQITKLSSSNCLRTLTNNLNIACLDVNHIPTKIQSNT